jgi:hypothetical protein
LRAQTGELVEGFEVLAGVAAQEGVDAAQGGGAQGLQFLIPGSVVASKEGREFRGGFDPGFASKFSAQLFGQCLGFGGFAALKLLRDDRRGSLFEGAVEFGDLTVGLLLEVALDRLGGVGDAGDSCS